MKKCIYSLFAILGLLNLAYGQGNPNYAPPVGGVTCNCTAPTSSTCTADCLFSTCCICWNPNTQNGACGCYWGIATCKTANITSGSEMNSSNFGELNPNARIKFSFEKFYLLFDFFKINAVNTKTMENVFLGIRSHYVLSGQKVDISNADFAQILNEYSKVIDLLNSKQKNDLNNFIKSIN